MTAKKASMESCDQEGLSELAEILARGIIRLMLRRISAESRNPLAVAPCGEALMVSKDLDTVSESEIRS